MIVRDVSCSDGILNLFLFEVLMMMLEWLRFFCVREGQWHAMLLWELSWYLITTIGSTMLPSLCKIKLPLKYTNCWPLFSIFSTSQNVLELGLLWFRFLFDSGEMRDCHGMLSAGEERGHRCWGVEEELLGQVLVAGVCVCAVFVGSLLFLCSHPCIPVKYRSPKHLKFPFPSKLIFSFEFDFY
jgi:hypothetical protein